MKLTLRDLFWLVLRELAGIGWRRASGRILRYWIKRSDGQRFYHPVLAFQTSEGREVVTISSWGSWRRPWSIGQTLYMIYNPTQPLRADVDSFVSCWGLLTTLVVLVLFFAFFDLLKRYFFLLTPARRMALFAHNVNLAA